MLYQISAIPDPRPIKLTFHEADQNADLLNDQNCLKFMNLEQLGIQYMALKELDKQNYMSNEFSSPLPSINKISENKSNSQLNLVNDDGEYEEEDSNNGNMVSESIVKKNVAQQEDQNVTDWIEEQMEESVTADIQKRVIQIQNYSFYGAKMSNNIGSLNFNMSKVGK